MIFLSCVFCYVLDGDICDKFCQPKQRLYVKKYFTAPIRYSYQALHPPSLPQTSSVSNSFV